MDDKYRKDVKRRLVMVTGMLVLGIFGQISTAVFCVLNVPLPILLILNNFSMIAVIFSLLMLEGTDIIEEIRKKGDR